MRWLGNLKVRGKILFLVVLMIVLLGVVGYTGYRFNTKAARDMESMYNDRVLPSQLLFDVLVHGRGIQANLFALMLTTDEKENRTLLNDIERRRDIVDKNTEAYSKGNLSETESKYLEKARKELALYRPITVRAMELAQANKNQEAYELFAREGLPIFDRYQTEIRFLSDYIKDSARAMHERNNEDAATAVYTILGLSLAAVLLALLFGLFIASRISAPLKTVVALAGRASDGDLTIRREEFRISTRDELGQMADAPAEMVAQQREALRAIAGSPGQLGSTARGLRAPPGGSIRAVRTSGVAAVEPLSRTAGGAPGAKDRSAAARLARVWSRSAALLQV